MIKAKNFSFGSDDEVFKKATNKNVELYRSILEGTSNKERVNDIIKRYSSFSGRKVETIIWYQGLKEFEEDVKRVKTFKKESSNKYAQHPNLLYPFRDFKDQLYDHLGRSWDFISLGKFDYELESFYRPGLIKWINKIRFLIMLKSYQSPINSQFRKVKLTRMFKYTKPDFKYVLLYNFFKDLGFPFTTAQNNMLEIANVISAGTYYLIKFSDNYVIIEKPSIKFNKHENSELSSVDIHCVTGPAMEFNDGSKYSYFYGKFMDNWLWDMENSVKKVRKILRIRDVELRRHAINYMGRDNLLSYLSSKIVDKKGDYMLSLFKIQSDREVPFLIMKNPSTGEEHIEGVHPDIRTVDEALGWRLGLEVFEKPRFRS